MNYLDIYQTERKIARKWRLNYIRENGKKNVREAMKKEISIRFPDIYEDLNEWQLSSRSNGGLMLQTIEKMIFPDCYREVARYYYESEIDIVESMKIFLEDNPEYIENYVKAIAWNHDYFKYKYHKGFKVYRGTSTDYVTKQSPLASWTSDRRIAKRFGYVIKEYEFDMTELRFVPELLPKEHVKEREFILAIKVGV